MTITNHNFISSSLRSIIVLDFSLSTLLSRQRLVLPYLRYKVGGTFTYKSEEYSVVMDAYQVWYKMTKESRRVMTNT